MIQNEMEKIVKAMAASSKGAGGFVEFVYQDTKLYLISDVAHDRMRIIAPIVHYSELTNKEIQALLSANFHTTLDARYAVKNDVVFSTFLHPMSYLTQELVELAVLQVTNLVRTFGSSYSSGVLHFNG